MPDWGQRIKPNHAGKGHDVQAAEWSPVEGHLLFLHLLTFPPSQ